MQLVDSEGMKRRMWLYLLPLLGLIMAAEIADAQPTCRRGAATAVQWSTRDAHQMRDLGVRRADVECGWAVCKKKIKDEIAYRMNINSTSIMIDTREIRFTRDDDYGFEGQVFAWYPARPRRDTRNGGYVRDEDRQLFFDVLAHQFSVSIVGTECSVGQISNGQAVRWQN